MAQVSKNLMSAGITFKVLCVGTLAAASAHAGAYDYIYTFEKPNFTLNQTAPLLNVAPNTGVPGFDTSFSGTFVVSDNTTLINTLPPLFSGMFLGQSGQPGSITFSFSAPILSLSVDFALGLPGSADLGWINFDGVGFWGTQDASAFPDVDFQGGTLVIDPGFEFSEVTLYGMNGRETTQFLYLDNLQIAAQPVPEPSTWAAIIAMAGIGGFHAARRYAARKK